MSPQQSLRALARRQILFYGNSFAGWLGTLFANRVKHMLKPQLFEQPAYFLTGAVYGHFRSTGDNLMGNNLMQSPEERTIQERAIGKVDPQ